MRISQAQLSRIIKGSREAGLDACLRIADALGISREEAFQVRGWLPYEAANGKKVHLTPETARIAVEIDKLPDNARRIAWQITQSRVNALREAERTTGI